MSMFKLFAAATIFGVIAGTPAFAADMSVRRAAPARVYSPAPPVANWNGFYAGYGWANTSITGASASSNLNGFVGGGQIGYNWQGASPLVVGLEADFQGSSQSRSDTSGGVTVDQKLPWFGTARARIGYAPADWMIYATGGAAWVNYKLTASSGAGSVSDSATKAAWTAGLGTEWMFAPRWSAKLEYLYIDTGTTTVTLAGVPISGRAKDNILRVGANYHF
jgi:outer membrane immunogenic protein